MVLGIETGSRGFTCIPPGDLTARCGTGSDRGGSSGLVICRRSLASTGHIKIRLFLSPAYRWRASYRLQYLATSFCE